MPFKLHSKGRSHIPGQRHRVTNWCEYDASLRNRGSLTIWFTPEAIAGWKAQLRTTPSGQRHYSDLAIETALTLTHRVSIGASTERRPDRIYHENAGDRPAASRLYDEPASVWRVVSLDQAARLNVAKTLGRWPVTLDWGALFDVDFPPEEQLPRQITMIQNKGSRFDLAD